MTYDDDDDDYKVIPRTAMLCSRLKTESESHNIFSGFFIMNFLKVIFFNLQRQQRPNSNSTQLSNT